jgi:hypothetical protein
MLLEFCSVLELPGKVCWSVPALQDLSYISSATTILVVDGQMQSENG